MSCWGSGQQGMSGSEMTAGSRNPIAFGRPGKSERDKKSLVGREVPGLATEGRQTEWRRKGAEDDR